MRIGVQFIQHCAIEVVLFVAVIVIVHLLLSLWLELLPIHAASNFLGHLVSLLPVACLDDDAQSVDQLFLRVVELRQLDGEVELVDQLVCFRLDQFGQLHEVLVHFERLFALVSAQSLKALQNLGDVDVVHLVDFDQVFEKHEHQVRKQSCLPAKVAVGELRKNLGHNFLEVVSVAQDLRGPQRLHFIRHVLHAFA